MPSVCVGGGVGGRVPHSFVTGWKKDGGMHGFWSCSVHMDRKHTHVHTTSHVFKHVPYYIHVYGDQHGRAGGKDRHNLGNEN